MEEERSLHSGGALTDKITKVETMTTDHLIKGLLWRLACSCGKTVAIYTHPSNDL